MGLPPVIIHFWRIFHQKHSETINLGMFGHPTQHAINVEASSSRSMEKYLKFRVRSSRSSRSSRLGNFGTSGNAWGCLPKSHEEPPQFETIQDSSGENDEKVANKLENPRTSENPARAMKNALSWRWVATCRSSVSVSLWNSGHSNTEMGRAARAISVKFPDQLRELIELSFEISRPNCLTISRCIHKMYSYVFICIHYNKDILHSLQVFRLCFPSAASVHYVTSSSLSCVLNTKALHGTAWHCMALLSFVTASKVLTQPEWPIRRQATISQSRHLTYLTCLTHLTYLISTFKLSVDTSQYLDNTLTIPWHVFELLWWILLLPSEWTFMMLHFSVSDHGFCCKISICSKFFRSVESVPGCPCR